MAKSPIKPKTKKQQQKNLQKDVLSKVFIDVSFGKEINKKDSYENNEEAEAIADYIAAYCENITRPIAVMSPFRTQALVIKNVLMEERFHELPVSVQNAGLIIGSFEDFVSCSFETVIVSLCKTEDDLVMQKPILSSKTVIDFIKTRVTGPNANLIVVGKTSSLPEEWRKEFVEDKSTQMLEM